MIANSLLLNNLYAIQRGQPPGNRPVSPSSFELAKNFTRGYFWAVNEPDLTGKKPAGSAKYAGLGLQLAACIIVFVFSGVWLDKKLGTSPLFTILLAFAGFGGFMWSLVRSLNRDNESQKK